MSHIGNCFCGAVKLEVTGSPVAIGYCHCSSCRTWSGGPVNAFSLWDSDAVTITAGAGHVATFQKTEVSQRKYCVKCGGHLMTSHPPIGLVDVFVSTIPTLEFKHRDRAFAQGRKHQIVETEIAMQQSRRSIFRGHGPPQRVRRLESIKGR